VSSMRPAGLHDVNFFALNMAQRKKDDPGQIAFTRDSSVTASRRSMGRRSVIPGRSSVHRCRRGSLSALPSSLPSSLPLDALPKLFTVAVEAHSLLSSVSKDVE